MLEASLSELLTIFENLAAKSKAHPKTSFVGVEFDSRRVKANQLFVALKGEKIHGEKFLAQVFSAGASLAIVEDDQLLNHPEFSSKIIVVKDSLQAFWQLAHWWRGKYEGPVIGVTGSVGKTTFKEMLAHILALRGKGTYSQKSFNNHTGVPYSISQINLDDNWVVLEMGMNHAGELANLSHIAQPDLAVITIVDAVHIEFFETLEKIAQAKCEIFSGLKRLGKALINNDCQVLRSEVTNYKLDLRTFGTTNQSQTWVSDLKSDRLNGISFVLHHAAEKQEIFMQILGQHNALIAAGAFAAAKLIFPDLSLNQVAQVLKTYTAPDMRLNLKELKDGRKIIDDSYNASPIAMKASLNLLAGLKSDQFKTAAILGDMFELGVHSDRLHQDVAQEISNSNLDFLITVGEKAKIFFDHAKKVGVAAEHAQSPELAAKIALDRKFDLLLVKGSRGMALDRAVKILCQ